MDDPRPTRHARGPRARAFVVGAVFCCVLCVGAIHTRQVLNSSLLDGEFLPFGVILGLLLLSAGANPLSRLCRSVPAFSPQEMAIIFLMGLVTTAVSSDGLGAFLLAVIAAPHYYASPENRWSEFLFEHMPGWLAPSNADNAMGDFFAGLPTGRTIPWSVWAVPVLWWLLLFAAMFLVCACLAAILHRQWADHERLRFPLMEAPLAMCGADEERGPAPALSRNGLFWFGFGVSLFVVVWNIGRFFMPMYPEIKLDWGWLALARAFPRARLYIIVPIIGFLYFVNLDVLFSIWAFYLLGLIQVGIYNRVGFRIGRADIYCSGSPSMGWQGFGALTAMVLWGLWMARTHLRSTWRSAWGRGPRPEAPAPGSHADPAGDTLLSYRFAWLGAAAGLAFLSVMLHEAGMEWSAIALFLFAAFVIFLGLTRIVVQCGIVFCRAPLTAQSFATHTLGTTNISAASMTSIALTYSWIHTVFFFMPVVAHAGRLCDVLHIPGRHMRRALLLALVVAVPTTVIYHLLAGYHYGAQNFMGWAFRGGCQIPYHHTVRKMANPESVDLKRLLFFGIGAVAMLTVTQLHYRFPWWPLHPIGMTVASTHPTRMIAFSLFLAWLLKLFIIRAGGLKWYERFKPFFLGLILGYFTGLAIAFVVDLLFFGPGQGHPLYSL